MFSATWLRAHGDEVIENGTQPPTTFEGCVGDGFWAFMLQDWAVQLENEGDDSARRALELLNWCQWWEGLGAPSESDAGSFGDQVASLGAGLVDDAAGSALADAVADGDLAAAGTAAADVAGSVREALTGSADGSGGDGFYAEFLSNAGVFQTYGINAYGADGVLSDPKDTELTGVLQVMNPDTGEFENQLQDWVPSEADFEEVARVNGLNVKDARDGARLPYLINGFLFLIGSGHDAYSDWAQDREEKGVQASMRGEVRVRKAGLRGAGYLDVSNCPPVSQQLVVDSAARFSEKEVRFV
jgi:hypothetical protein